MDWRLVLFPEKVWFFDRKLNPLYFQDGHYSAKGDVQNEVDQICKNLQNGYQCIIKEDSQECIPWEINYNGTTGSGTILAEQDLALMVAIQCEARNSQSCARQACMVEAFFSLSIVQLFFSGYQFEEELQHSSGFDPQFECNFRRKNQGTDRVKQPRNQMPPARRVFRIETRTVERRPPKK